LFGLSKSNSVVLLIEEGVVLSHEDISKNHVIERWWEGGSHNSHHALSDSHIGDLDNVVVVGQDVVNSINGEGDVGEIFNAFAGSLDSDAVNEFVDESLWANND